MILLFSCFNEKVKHLFWQRAKTHIVCDRHKPSAPVCACLKRLPNKRQRIFTKLFTDLSEKTLLLDLTFFLFHAEAVFEL